MRQMALRSSVDHLPASRLTPAVWSAGIPPEPSIFCLRLNPCYCYPCQIRNNQIQRQESIRNLRTQLRESSRQGQNAIGEGVTKPRPGSPYGQASDQRIDSQGLGEALFPVPSQESSNDHFFLFRISSIVNTCSPVDVFLRAYQSVTEQPQNSLTPFPQGRFSPKEIK